MKFTVLRAAALSLALSSPVLAADIPADVARAVADTNRPAADSTRDAARLPAETLSFAGIKSGMTVGELTPGGGYFTRMLSDIVGPSGKVYVLENPKWEDVAAEQKAMAGYKNVTVEGAPFGTVDVPEKLDLFWITQNYHDLHIAKYGPVDMAAFNKAVFDHLKPGGLYFILDHQANAATDEAAIAKLHRIEKSKVISEVEAAGFKLAREGDFLHRDGDDHTKPIFDDAIKGKTDQFALVFQKP